MKIPTKYLLPAAALAVFAAASGTALAAQNGFIDASALTGFSSTQREAIQQAFEIREQAREEEQKILDDAGVDRQALHAALKEQRDIHRQAVDQALTNNDYQAFLEAIDGSPRADTMTEEIFNTMVEAHQLREAGDEAGARELMKEIAPEAGFGPGMAREAGPGHHGMMMNQDTQDNN